MQMLHGTASMIDPAASWKYQVQLGMNCEQGFLLLDTSYHLARQISGESLNTATLERTDLLGIEPPSNSDWIHHNNLQQEATKLSLWQIEDVQKVDTSSIEMPTDTPQST